MASGPLQSFLRRLRGSLRPGGAPPDADLLERFVAVRDESAFEMLLSRHGPMVLGVCRRLLSREEDCEDAFQATFLTLARKAASIRRREAPAGWLYRTAYRIALDARTSAARSAAHERSAADLSAAVAADDVSEQAGRRELLKLLDAEIQRLPRKYRDPLVLCHLEGKTQEEAAGELGWAKGTVSTRLLRARELLRRRLSRHGEVLSTTTPLPGLATQALPSGLVSATLRTACALPPTTAVAGAASSQALALTERAIQAMTLKPWKIAAVFLMALGVVGPGVGWLGYRAFSGPPAVNGHAQAAPPALGPQTKPTAAPPREDTPGKQAEKKEALRYDGKNFEEWRSFLRTELKAERLTEGLHAMGVFGVNGYGKESAEAVLELALKYLKLNEKTDEDWTLISKAQSSLTRIGQPAAPLLVETLKERDAAVRLFTLKTLPSVKGRQDTMPFLVEALSDSDAAVRRFAATTLNASYESLPSTAVPALLRAVLDQDNKVSTYALAAVFRADKLIAAVQEAVRDENLARGLATALTRVVTGDGGFQFGAAKLLGMLGPHAHPSVPTLLAVLKEEPLRGNRPSAAILALGEIGADAKVVVPELNHVLQRSPQQYRGYAAIALARFGGEAKPALPDLLAEASGEREKVPGGKAKGASLGGGILERFAGTVASEIVRGTSEKTDKVSGMLKNPIWDRYAPDSLRTSGKSLDPPIVWSLAVAYQHFPADRVLIVERLGLLGPSALVAIPELEQALESPEPDVRRAAAAAIKKILSTK